MVKLNTIPDYSDDDKLLKIEFNVSDIFDIFINKTEKYNFSESNILYIVLYCFILYNI